MAVVEVEVLVEGAVLSAETEALVERIQAHVEAFVESRIDDPIPGFVPSDFGAVARTLAAVRRSWQAPGEAFLEWGSGLGGVAILAAHLGFHAQGIEIEGPLVESARALAEEVGSPVEFHLGSFVPVGGEDLVPPMDELSWLDTDGESAYEAIGLDVDDFDVVFAYPWPGEEDVVFELFDRFAAVGALLVTFQGRDAVQVRRKVRDRR